MNASNPSEFEQAMIQEANQSFVREFWGFLKHNKKWWLLPIVIVLLMFAILLLFSSSAAAPFIYTLF